MASKVCELCSSPAQMFCESDQASLCWDCDEKVHAANFLVAKHSRILLCHLCHSPTPWTASGLKLCPTVSVCHACTYRGESATSSRRRDGAEHEDGVGYESPESESDDGEYYDDSEGLTDDEEDGENQVVPWSDTGSNSPPAEEDRTYAAAAAASYSDGDDDVSLSSLKRTRFESEGENMCCSSGNLNLDLNLDLNQRESDENVGCSSGSSRPSKMHRRSNGDEQASHGHAPSGTAAIVQKLRRFQQEIAAEEASSVFLSLCKLNKD